MFNRRKLVSQEMAAWVFDNYAFLGVTCKLQDHLQTLALITPTTQFFKAKGGTDHQTALAVFDDVKGLMGLTTRDITLVRLSGQIEGVDHHNYQSKSVVAGTYLPDQMTPEISYNPDHMQNRLGFIATLAHELAHDVLDIPGIDHSTGEHELQTDFLCIIMGFGVIQAMGARETGWLGYLSNESRMFGLALFLTLHFIPASDASAYLDGNLRKKLNRAVKQLESYTEEITALRDRLQLPPPR